MFPVWQKLAPTVGILILLGRVQSYIINGSKKKHQKRKDFREISTEEGIQFAKSRAVDGFIECSAKTGENVEEMFGSLTRLMIDNREKLTKENKTVLKGINYK